MLELRPNCERCDCDLPPDSEKARICTYECTFCGDCVDTHLENVCPNCGGGFQQRPIRPKREWRKGVSLAHQPASSRRRLTTYTDNDLLSFVDRVRFVPPAER